MSDSQVDAIAVADNYLKSRRRSVVTVWILTFLVAALVVIVPIAVIRQNEVLHGQSDIQQLQRRTDCARAISDTQNLVVRTEYNAKARLDSAYIKAQLEVTADPTRRDYWIGELDRLQNALTVSVDAVEALPNLQSVVERKCPSTR